VRASCHHHHGKPRIRELLQAHPRTPATVVAERIGRQRSLTVLKDRVRELRPYYLLPDPRTYRARQSSTRGVARCPVTDTVVVGAMSGLSAVFGSGVAHRVDGGRRERVLDGEHACAEYHRLVADLGLHDRQVLGRERVERA